jgi:quercetin dioxygenase-like cupin family protein
LKFDLADEADALRREVGWRKTGHSAKTLAKHRGMTTVLIAMKRHTRMKEHRASGAVSIHVLFGHIRLHLGSWTIDAASGSILALDRAQSHDVAALDDSVFVLSVGSVSSDRRAR